MGSRELQERQVRAYERVGVARRDRTGAHGREQRRQVGGELGRDFRVLGERHAPPQLLPQRLLISRN